jgi:hypothetical protein
LVPEIAVGIGIVTRLSRCVNQVVVPASLSSQLMQQIEAQASMKPDQLVNETIRIAVSAVAYAIGFAFLAGVLPRAHAARSNLRYPPDTNLLGVGEGFEEQAE